MRKEKNDTQITQISDLTLAVTLLLFDFPLKQISASNPNRAIFEFTSSEKLKKTIERYWNGQIKVEPKQFNYVLRELKARLRNKTEAKNRL